MKHAFYGQIIAALGLSVALVVWAAIASRVFLSKSDADIRALLQGTSDAISAAGVVSFIGNAIQTYVTFQGHRQACKRQKWWR